MASERWPSTLRELLQDRVVGLGLDHDRGEQEVLRRRPDHRRAADVDVLDHLGLVDPAARRGLLERVEVHAHEVDELDVVLLGRDHVGGVVAAREQAGVELRVQRLDAAAHDLGEAGEVVDRADGEARPPRAPGRCRRWRRARRRARRGPSRTRRSPSCPTRRAPRGGSEPRLAASSAPDDSQDAISTRRGFAGSIRTASRAISRTASHSSSCSIGRSAARTSAASVGRREIDRALQDDRAGVDALVDEVHRHAEHLDAVGERLLDRADAGEGGQQRRVDVDHALGEAAEERRG